MVFGVISECFLSCILIILIMCINISLIIIYKKSELEDMNKI